ncbi:two-component system response regulator [Amycolatopsis mediterranei S699]|uniref:Two-component system response regulator n=2 Tax=Amycolatopsis mediterranei TaxID=33910 RepID=A0A0H3D4D6_AMYMU|nr:response regulator transcription factor [Amycolatopsis mediterranei]ADJ45830.1 two-component system response regulator [Amycolatopsis mediterranei U32]AEK42611.1 two-component system response regulator [Amycolatopsis mediterranei S699]AFO77541.1 two-component system response regulator [Amycolatopsis mediterranei S699]AGT84669.1 two-component system response regulator [Amycolatopsis mediterranei RB]KDO05365.1 transcriptional regulator [Amycolatopsis mediterranei]
MRVLLVEDEQPLAKYVAAGLRKHGFAVDVAFDGRTALDKCTVTPYDVVVLDRDLPVVHGDAVCRELAGHGTARVLMLTASGTVEDRVEGLTLGADDYLGKPFAFSELVARVRALSRRSTPAMPPVLRAGGVVLDPARRTAERAGRLLHLTPKEFGVLEHLLAADGAVVSAETLLDKVWDEHADPFTNAVRITVGTLRRKLGDPPPIETVPSAGYRIVP